MRILISELLEQLQEKLKNIETNNFYLLLTVLEPWYKTTFCNNPDDVKSIILQALKNLSENARGNLS